MIDVTRRLRVLALAASILAFLSGCNKEEEPPVLSDVEMIRRYIGETEEGRDLFRTNGLITTDSYTVSSDPGAVYSDSVLSVIRSIEVDVFLDTTFIAVISPLYLKGQPATATITDEIKLLSRKSSGGLDSTWEYSVWIERSGLFVKVGSDLQSYAGWKMYAINLDQPFPLGNPNVEMTVPGGSTYPADASAYQSVRVETLDSLLDTVLSVTLNYQWLLDMPIMTEGDSLTFVGTSFPTSSRSMLISGDTDSGFRQYQMDHPDDSRYEFTIGTPSNNIRIWNIIFLREIRGDWIRPSDLGQRGWCAAYRLPQ